MRVVAFSYKRCWPMPDAASGYATDGGFPIQMAALSELFDETILVLPRRSSPAPEGLRELAGNRLSVRPMPEPPGSGLGRKLTWLVGGLVWLPRMWREAGRGDVVHAVVPGDVGFIGLVLALLRRKLVFVRHCGTWGQARTLADRLLLRLLVRVAGKRCVVLATGGGSERPEPQNPAIRWIFSTTLSQSEIENLSSPVSRPDPPRLISVGRLTAGKNVAATIRALADLRQTHPGVVLDVVGRGPEGDRLRDLARDLGLGDAVVFHGNLDHEGVLRHLRRARALVFPTRVAEGFPKAVLEALACGVPVIAPRVSVLPHLLDRGGGLLIDDVSPATLAGAIRHLLDEPDDRAEQACRTARDYTLEAWRDVIGRRLEAAWGKRLREEGT